MTDITKLTASVDLLSKKLDEINKRLIILETADAPKSKKKVKLGKSGYRKGSSLDVNWEKENKKK